MAWLVLAMGLAGCASDLPVIPGEETSAGSSTGDDGPAETGSSGLATTGTSGDAESGESSDTGIEPGCGNGIVEAGEACDEQGATATCDEDCTPVDCGDGVVNEAAGEDCDDGGATETCNLHCTLPRCGDGEINVEGEVCDDGAASAFCDEDCTLAECGDGVLNVPAGEDCDDVGESAACDQDCTLASCGDGVVNVAAGEQCDGMGRTDACDPDCSLAGCGDGVVNATAGELCDDGGETATCDVDCTPVACGDGLVNVTVGEACDGGGETAACNTDCSIASCGDGITNVTAGEACDGAGETVSCDGDCTAAVCGDATINALAGEICEVTDLVGETCEGVGYGIGTLACPGCSAYETSGCTPAMPVLSLSFSPVKRFDFSWAATQGAEYYQLLESTTVGDPYGQLGGDIVGTSASFEMPLHFRWQASYVLRACNAAGCTDSAAVDVVGSLAEAVGYFKASINGAGDVFGYSVALSGDGNTLAVGAYWEDSNATGIGGNPADDSSPNSGAVYVLTRNGLGAWSQQAYIKASNTGANDNFGYSVALSGDGNTLAVGAPYEASNAIGNPADNSSPASGAVYVLTRDGMDTWSQQAYVKASNTGANDLFGWSVALSGDGSILAVGAPFEDSNATGIGGNQADNSSPASGAVYMLTRNGLGTWSQQTYVKPSTTGAGYYFGWSVALSDDGNTLAVGASFEDSNATGINGNQANNSSSNSGAVYVLTRNVLGVWSQQAYVKASNTGANDYFGGSVALSGDGDTLAVGADQEDSNATGIGGNQADNSSADSGAVYVFTRDDTDAWSQHAYVKASNTGADDRFGTSVALSGDGDTLAVGVFGEDSNATGIGGNQADNSSVDSGAVYVLTRDGMDVWSQQAYVKASNTGAGDVFGHSVALSGDGNTLAVGARGEDSNATGIAGNQADDSSTNSGAVHLY